MRAHSDERVRPACTPFFRGTSACAMVFSPVFKHKTSVCRNNPPSALLDIPHGLRVTAVDDDTKAGMWFHCECFIIAFACRVPRKVPSWANFAVSNSTEKNNASKTFNNQLTCCAHVAKTDYRVSQRNSNVKI